METSIMREKLPGLFDTRIQCTMVPKSIGEALPSATKRKYKNEKIDRIIKVGVLKQGLCKEVVSSLPEYFLE